LLKNAFVCYGAFSPQWIMRLLVLQARLASDPMLEHERRCFAAATGHDESELHFRNMVEEVPRAEAVLGHDALLIGGSGDFSVAAPDHPFFAPVAGLLRTLVRRRFPIFGSCFGYQLLVDALGGHVDTDPTASEVGSFRVMLTDDGKQDELFGRLPDEFVAQMGHLDRATELPPGLLNLAVSRRCPHQALRVPGAPIWATQFHPELDDTTNLDRCVAYAKQYLIESEEPRRPARPSPDASTIIPLFLELGLNGRAPTAAGGPHRLSGLADHAPA
jgi:GMP synthase (glutamine-hydrolysing)